MQQPLTTHLVCLRPPLLSSMTDVIKAHGCRSIVEVGAYNAVKNATCQKHCLEGGLIQACPASLLAPAPGPGSNLASEFHQEYVLPNGTLSTTYQKGARALPAGALDFALQTGAPPRHPPVHVPQVHPISANMTGCKPGHYDQADSLLSNHHIRLQTLICVCITKRQRSCLLCLVVPWPHRASHLAGSPLHLRFCR